MAQTSNPTQIWKGKFSYDPEEYGQSEDVNFELYIVMKDSTFEGVVYDDEFRSFSDLLPKVKGFIDNQHINFVVTYPIAYSIDDDDVISIDPTQKGHDVAYDGHYLDKLGKWVGKWEILPKKIKNKEDEYFQHHSIGDWEMEM